MSSAESILDFKPETRLYVDGGYTASRKTPALDHITLIDPSSGKPLPWRVHTSAKEDVNAAVDAATKVLKGVWGSSTGRSRRDLMINIATEVSKRKEDLALLESLQGGKPINEARGDVDEVIEMFRFFAGFADKLSGRMMQVDHDYLAYTLREPVGIGAVLTSFNYPISLTCWKLAPALAGGCAIILKPHETTPLSCLLLAQICTKAGLPPGVFSVLPGGTECGRMLVSHPLVDKVSFTGSTEVGRMVMRGAAESEIIKSLVLELGGKSPIIVCEDVANRPQTIAAAVRDVAGAILANAGQNCCAGSRLYLHQSLAKDFMSHLKHEIEKVRIGPATDGDSNFGPLANRAQFDKVMSFLQNAREEGWPILTGGHRHGSSGYFVEPTVFYDVDDGASIARDEVFGPILAILKPFDRLEEVIERANNSPNVLAAGIFSRDADVIHHLTRKVKAGTTWVNTYNLCLPYMPFGGFKNSGFGKDLGQESMEEWTTCRSVVQAVNDIEV